MIELPPCPLLSKRRGINGITKEIKDERG